MTAGRRVAPPALAPGGLGEMTPWVYAVVFSPDHVRTTVNRRRFLSALSGLAGTAGLAGCLGGPGGTVGTDTPPPTDTPLPTDSGDGAVTPAEQSFEVLDRGCGQAENSATVSFGEDSVTVEGVIGGRDTCDTARLASAGLHHDVLTVVVEVVEAETEGTPVCGQCLTDIEYAYHATGLRGGPARVRVVHRTADGEETVTVADRP